MDFEEKGFFTYRIKSKLLDEVKEASKWIGIDTIAFIRGSLRLAIRKAQKEGFNFDENISISKVNEKNVGEYTQFQLTDEKKFIDLGHKLAVSHLDSKGKNMTLKRFLTDQIKLNIKRLKKQGFGDKKTE